MGKIAAIILLILSHSNLAFGVDELIIKSKHLGYNVRYWVYVPKNVTEKMPVLYVTDGRGYKANGLIRISASLVKENEIIPHIIVMVDAIDPDDQSINHRNSQFLCNADYLNFYKEELIPTVTQHYNTLDTREQRGILGLSFGGLNAMYFGLHGSDTFGKIGIQSPAPHPCPSIYSDYENSDQLPIDIFLSTGTQQDKATESRKFKHILEAGGYEFKYIEVSEGHNWNNWQPLLDDILLYFYAVKN